MNRDILAAHPSVQDLGIQYGGINLAKTAVHRMLINQKPLHEMSNSDFAAIQHKHRGNRATEPKDAKVTVIRNNGVSSPISGGAIASPTAQNYSLPALPAASPVSVPRSPSIGNAGNTFSVTNARTGAAKKVVTQLPPRRNPSLVSSAFSYSAGGCSDCGSFSMYSCSCCHVKPPSTVASAATSISGAQSSASSNAKRRSDKKKTRVTSDTLKHLGGGADDRNESDLLDEYENLTSVSQRISNASVTSSQIATLKQELESERRTRLQTQMELRQIRERQQALLDRLASKDHANMNADDKYTIRRMLKEVNQQLKSMGVDVDTASQKVTGSTVGAPVAASDSVLQ